MNKIKWSLQYSACVKCGTSKIPHKSNGLCSGCYQKKTEQRNSSLNRKRGGASNIITKDFLIKEYIENKNSLADIAKICFCSRQYIHKMIKHFKIPLRTKTKAREIALNKHKLDYTRKLKNGKTRKVKPVKHTINKSFFSKWSEEMAYVLGWLYTDGNLHSGRITLGLADKEPLLKVLKLMESNAPIFYSEEKKFNGVTSGAIYYFQISNIKIYNDLITLGLTPKKSRTITFPKVPETYLRHFVRGCWDGDGSVYISNKNIFAHYVTGSKLFIEILVKKLKSVGLPDRTIYQSKDTCCYYIRYSGKSCIKLFKFFYDGVNESKYLRRKFEVFNSFFYEKYSYNEFSLTELPEEREERSIRVSQAIKEYKKKNSYKILKS